MGNWSELHPDLLAFIAQRINKFEDFVRFGAVCTSWHLAAVRKNFKGLVLKEQMPYLMLATEGDDNPEREFYCLSDNEVVAKVSLPGLKGKKCIESLGWLLCLGREGDMSLLNPLTGVEIELPHQATLSDDDGGLDPFIFVQKMVLSSRPQTSSDFIVMIIWGGLRRLGFWRPGAKEWIMLETWMAAYIDVTYYNGQFYAIDARGFVVVFDLEGPNPSKGRIFTYLTNNKLEESINRDEVICAYMKNPRNEIFLVNELVDGMDLYVVASSGALIVIARDARLYEEDRIFYDTCEFHVYKVDISTGKWQEINNLESKAAFLGCSATTLVEASQFPVLKANHIYYTINCWMDEEGQKSKDIGVYNLETGDIESFYHGDEDRLCTQISPAIWVQPSF